MPNPTGVRQVLQALMNHGLLDSIGVAANPSDSQGEGVRYGMSDFSGDEIETYYVNVSVWGSTDYDPEDHIDSLEHETEPLIRLTGPNWMLSLTQGRPESEIDDDILEQLLAALPDSEVFTALPIPEPEWFDMSFGSATELLQALVALGFTTLPVHPDDVEEATAGAPYLRESLEDDTFAVARLGRAGSPTTVVVHVFIDERRARDTASMLDAYKPWVRPHAVVAANGWAVRVIQPSGELSPSDVLTVWAQAIFLGMDADLCDPASPAYEGFGPQNAAVEHALEQLGSMTPEVAAQFDADWVRDSREEARNRASRLMARLDRRWPALMELTGPDAPAPHWYAQARSKDRDGEIARSAWGALYTAQCATAALAVRDVPESEGGLTDDEFNLLTRAWFTIFGRPEGLEGSG